MLVFGFLVAAAARLPRAPRTPPLLFESFGDNSWRETWKISEISNVTGKWKVKETDQPQAISGEKMLFADKANSYYGLSRALDEPIDVSKQTLIVQYETRFLENIQCAGAYIKLFGRENFAPEKLCNETKYVIMFGPDKCGDTDKVHFIFRNTDAHGNREEKHMTDAPKVRGDSQVHLYTLVVRPDHSFEVLIDGVSEKNGTLVKDFDPSVIPPKMIDDPNDVKPADWVDEEEIPDMSATKPDDWDENEPEYIPDPNQLTAPEGWLFDEPPEIPDTDLSPPSDWDEEQFGPWEPPMIDNPKCDDAPGCGEYHPPLIKNEKYKGKWEPPMIKNPAYKGPFKPRQIPNPDYSEDVKPNLDEIVGIGFELWMVDKDVGFGNVYVGRDEVAMKQWNEDHFLPKKRRQDKLKEDEEEKQAMEMEKQNAEQAPQDGEELDEDEDDMYRKHYNSYQEALLDFFNVVQDSWWELYNEDQTMTQMITALVLFLPVLIFFYSCCRCSPKPTATERKERKERHKKRLEELAQKHAKYLFEQWLKEHPDPNAPPQAEPEPEEEDEEESN